MVGWIISILVMRLLDMCVCVFSSLASSALTGRPIKRRQPLAGRKGTNAFLSVWTVWYLESDSTEGQRLQIVARLRCRYALPKSSSALTLSPIFLFLRFLRWSSAASTLISLGLCFGRRSSGSKLFVYPAVNGVLRGSTTFLSSTIWSITVSLYSFFASFPSSIFCAISFPSFVPGGIAT